VLDTTEEPDSLEPAPRAPRSDGARRLCEGQDLVDLTGRRSLRFDLGLVAGPFGPVMREGFAVRTLAGEVRAFVNVCPHRGQPIDLGDGRLWDKDGLLECQAHGAHFDAVTGVCVKGPCEGKSLTPLEVFEEAGEVFLRAPDDGPVDDVVD
jgi:nitrite reductase/ring-hydroxylating ferredoxin subunit